MLGQCWLCSLALFDPTNHASSHDTRDTPRKRGRTKNKKLGNDAVENQKLGKNPVILAVPSDVIWAERPPFRTDGHEEATR